MSAPTIKELCQAATPWELEPGSSLEERRHDDQIHHARRMLSARLSPDVVLKVVDYLEYIATNDSMDPALVANKALQLLNGQPPAKL